MTKDYEVNKHNSTVCGYPGRDFDWSKFDWNGGTPYFDTLGISSQKVIFSPKPYVDDCLIAPDCEYLHVPYDWAEDCTIYRVRPNESMYAGEIYRGKLVKSVKAIKKADGWYWRIEND